MIVYLDIVMVISFYCNSLILLLTKRLIRVQTSWYRLMCGSIFATFLVPLTLFYPQSIFTTVLGKICYSMVIIICTFGFRKVNQTLKYLFTFYFISIAMGGGLFGIHFFINQTLNQKATSYSTFNHVGIFIVLLGLPCIYFFIKLKMDSHVKDKINYDQLYSVMIEINGKEHKTMGFIDSGNQLNDTLTNKPVAICDDVFLKLFFSEEEWYTLKTALCNQDYSEVPNSLKHLISVVPYQDVSGQSNFLYVVKSSKLTIYYGEQTLESNHVPIGIQFASLSSDGQYHCLLHPEMITFSTVKTA